MLGILELVRHSYRLVYPWVMRLLIRLHISAPFEPVSADRYIEHASRYTFNKLTDEQAAEFQSDVDAFIRDHQTPYGNHTIIDALSLFSNLDHEEFTLNPAFESQMQFIQHRKMMEVLVKNGVCYVALFHAQGGNVRKLSLHQRVYNWRDARLRRVRYLEAADESMRPVTRFEKSFIYNPFEPIVVYKPEIGLDHALRKWLALDA